MDDSPEDWRKTFDALDDWQRGFIESVFYAQQISNPTPAQYAAALKRMNGFVLSRYGGAIPPDGRMSFATGADN